MKEFAIALSAMTASHYKTQPLFGPSLCPEFPLPPSAAGCGRFPQFAAKRGGLCRNAAKPRRSAAFDRTDGVEGTMRHNPENSSKRETLFLGGDRARSTGVNCEGVLQPTGIMPTKFLKKYLTLS